MLRKYLSGEQRKEGKVGDGDGDGGRNQGRKEGRKIGVKSSLLTYFLKHSKLLKKSQCPSIKEIPNWFW